MCAEALWTNCHRCIIAEEMTRHGFAVTHIMPENHARPSAPIASMLTSKKRER